MSSSLAAINSTSSRQHRRETEMAKAITEAQLVMLIPVPRADAPGEPPLGMWGPTDPRPTPPIAMPPGGGPGGPPGGGAAPPEPAHPIVLPPPEDQPPLVIWGPPDGRPTPPIYLPGIPGGPETPPDAPKFEWRTGWTEEHGWVVVGIPTFPHPAPSKKR